ncbi:FGGY family carbohydrate kinase [Candidatus Leptofilum sp.]|uniref:FGGY family carbohydrate kinase n=1 Tax=Candidatus Leptofilum sp. TaxID=3241576 RepID=UPI003B5B23D9
MTGFADPQSDKLILALDVGTLSVRASAYDYAGNALAFADQPIALHQISSRQIEQDPTEINTAVHKVMQHVLDDPVVQKRGVACAGLACQRSSIVAWNRHNGVPLTPVLSWQDRRAAEYLVPLASKGVAIKKKSGLFLSPHYGASKLRWMLDNYPELERPLQNKTLIFGPLAAFVIANLLKGTPCIVDHVNASRTQLMDLQKHEWSSELLREFGIDRGLLPDCQPTQSYFGTIRGTEIPLTAVNGDQNAAIHGPGKLEDGTLIVNVGTGAFVLLSTNTQLMQHPSLLASIANSSDDHVTYLLEGTVNGAGAAIKWAADQWQEPNMTAHLAEWLSEVEAPPIFINTIGGLGSPFWRSEQNPRFLSNGQSEPSLGEQAVAIIESILFLVAINLEAMSNTGQSVKRIRITGGLSALDGLCQRLANLTQRVVLRPQVKQATSQGIAWLAANLSQGWHDLRDGSHVDYFLPKDGRSLKARYRQFCSELGWR